MGSSDIPPPTVPSYFHPISNLLLQVGGSLWTIAYILLFLRSLRDRSYGMPLLALALNFGWEFVYGLFVAEEPLERAVFCLWLVIDVGLIYGLLAHGRREWQHAPTVADNLGKIFAVVASLAIVGHGCFAKWWIDNGINGKKGMFYQGVEGAADMTELAFWSAAVTQAYLSAASLAMLIVRNHSRGVGWSIWLTRTLGSVIGFYLYYAWRWYLWREAHAYFVTPFALFLVGVSFVSDLVYPYVLWQVKRAEDKSGAKRKDEGGSNIVGKGYRKQL